MSGAVDAVGSFVGSLVGSGAGAEWAVAVARAWGAGASLVDWLVGEVNEVVGWLVGWVVVRRQIAD